MKDFPRRRATIIGAGLVLLLGVGYGVLQAPDAWTPLLRFLLLLLVGFLALSISRPIVGIVIGLIGLGFLLPGFLRSVQVGDVPEVVYSLVIGLLVVLLSWSQPILNYLRRHWTRFEHSLAFSPPAKPLFPLPVTDFQTRQLEEMTVVVEIARAISSTLDPKKTMEVVLGSIRRLIAFDMAEVTLWDPQQEVLVSQAALDTEAYHAEVGNRYALGEGFSGWLAEHRCPLLIEDIPTREDVRPKLDRPDYPFRSYMGIPLESKGEFIGSLELISYQPAAFTSRDLKLLQAIGLQTAVALENARFYQQAQQRAAELASLTKVSAVINSTLDLNEVLDTIANSVLELVGCQLAAIFVLDVETQQLRLSATRGLSEKYVEQSRSLPVTEGGRTHAVATGQPLIVDDTTQASGLTSLAPFAEEEGFRSFADIPLQAGERTIGMLCAFFQQPHRFTELERDILDTLADQAAIAIENANLYAQADLELRRRTAALSGLRRVARELSTTLDQDHVLQLVLEETSHLGQTTHTAVLLQDPDTQKWELAICMGYLEEEQAALRAHLRNNVTTGPLGEVIRSGQPMRLNSAQGVSVAEDLPPAHSALFVPIWYGDSLTGIIMLESVELRAFDDEAQSFVEGLAAQAAIAIANSRRYQEELERSDLLRKQASQLSHILEVSQAIRSDQPLEGVLTEIAHAVRESMGFDMTLINILEGDPPHLRRVASAGIPDDVFQRMKDTTQPWSVMEVVTQEEFRVSQSYYVPAEQQSRWRGVLDVYDTVRAEVEREPGTWHPQDLLIVPLLGPEGEIRGTMSVDKPYNNQAPDRTTIEGLEVFAAQGAVAIENARLIEALQRRLDLLTFFNELNRSVTAKLNLDEVLQAVVEAIVRLIHCDGSVLFLLDEEKELYVPQAVYGHDLDALSEQSFTIGEGLMGKVAASGMPLTVTDVEAQSDEAAYVHQGALILVPLEIGGKVVGVLAADRKEKEGFSPTDVATLIALADQVSLAVQNARLFNETVRRSNELSILLEANSAISSTLDLKWMLQALGDRLLSVTGAQRCHLSQWNREEDELSVVWEVGDKDVDHSRIGAVYEAPQRPGAMTEVLLIQEPLTLDAQELWVGSEMIEQEQETGQVLLLPMVARGRTVGLVELEQLSNGRRFVADDIRLAQALANQAAVAIENAQLFERTRRFTEELEQRVKERTQELARVLEDLTIERDRVEVLYRVASELSSSLDLDQVLNRTLELVEDAVGATEGAILLREAESGRLMCRATTGADAPLPPGGKVFSLPKGEGLIWWIIRNGKMVVVDDLHADSRWMKRDGRHSCLATPLGAAGEVQGVLTLYHHEVDHFTSDHVRLIEAAGSQISNAIGNAALYNLIRDQAEQLGTMLKQQQVEAAKSQAILEGVADGVMVADAQGHVILFNAAAEHVLGIPREKVLGRSTREMMGLYGVEGRSWMAAINEWIANPSDHAPGDFTAEQIQVGERIVSVHVSPVIMGTEFLGTVSVFRDITVEVEADRAKSEFVSTVSHELRTPMTSIKGYADLLLMGAVGGLSEQQRHFMNIIRNNANRLTSLVNDLLDISRIETGRVELNLRAVPISEIVDQVITTLEGRAHERGLELRKAISDDALPVWGDSDRLTQILTNLVGNAIQYTPSGGHITVAAQPDGDMLEVAVIDTGIGISEENLRKIFDRFFRADDPFVQETSGTGLGLAITTSLVHMHGGEIWVESELGEGSTFFFTLPFARSVTSDELLPPGTDNSQILVVEDDQDVADLIRIHLESRNYKVAIAERGEEALEMASRLQPALITLDIRLPDADGFFILQELKKKPETANIPVVIVSVMTTAEESLRLGAVDYVGKPIDENALLGAVKQVLDKRGLILVVEDDRDILALIRDALKRQGYRVRTTRRGRRALQVAREAHPALILLDMRLEDIDGYQVLRNLKSQPQTQDIPIVVITGSLTQEELKNEVLALGAARFLTKPFAVEELIHEIAAVLEQPEAQGEVVSD